MFRILALAMIPVCLGACFFFYRFLRKMLCAFGANVTNKKLRAVLLVPAIVLGACCVDITSTFAVALLHVMVFSLLMQCINFAVKQLWRAKYNTGFHVWKKVYNCGIVPVLVTAVLLLWGVYNMNNVVETAYTVYTDKDIRPQGYRIALIADVHFGVSLNEEQLQAVCAEISEKDADAVVLCGDIVDESTTAEGMQAAFQALGSIESRYGVYFVYGNHDRPHRGAEGSFAQDMPAVLQQNGIQVLQDTWVTLNDELVLAGREDAGYSGGGNRMPIDQLLNDIPSNAFILVADHQPTQYTQNSLAGTDLLVSGHTHGGQLWPLDTVQKLLNINDGVYGHIQAQNNFQAIVTSGLAGWKYAIKTAAPAEYVVVDIMPGQSAG